MAIIGRWGRRLGACLTTTCNQSININGFGILHHKTTSALTNFHKLHSTSTLSSSDNLLQTLGSTKILANDSKFKKSNSDVREYMAVELENGMQILLVSAQDSDVEAAAVHIKSGHFDDPSNRAGLAHFHEHMLFLGTQKYPDEDDYEAFLSQYGGSSNAYTDMEDTCYYFSITSIEDSQHQVSDGLAGALDRLAHFFINPLFDSDSVDREIRAIDSEYKNAISSDSWRDFQLFKNIANPNHPFYKFGCGNYDTLTQHNTTLPLEDLKAFWNDYYHANNAKLCVVGKAPVEKLLKVVENTFGQIRSQPDFIRETSAEDAFPKEALGIIRQIKPLQLLYKIKISFSMPPTIAETLSKSKPHFLASHLLGHEGPNTLHHFLSQYGYINSLSSGTSIDTSTFSLFSITLSLTPDAMKNHQQTILNHVFEWIQLIKSCPNSQLEQYHQELQTMSKIRFTYRDPADPLDFVSFAAKAMFKHDPQDILSAASFYDSFDEKAWNQFCNKLSPENAIITIYDPEVSLVDNDTSFASTVLKNEVWQTEQWYKGQYRQTSIPETLSQQWNDNICSSASQLKLPSANPFIPDDFTIRGKAMSTTSTYTPPNLLVDKPKLKLWHKLDETFLVPKSTIRLFVTSPIIYSNPRTITLCRLFNKLFNEDLNSYVYDASIAGCNYNIVCTPTGFQISTSGYSQKVPFLFNTILTRIKNLLQRMKENNEAQLQLQFNKAIDNLLRETKNYKLDTPYEINNYNSRLIMEEKAYHVDAYIHELENTQFSLVECATLVEQALFDRIKIDSLVMGNTDQEDAMNVYEILNDNFASSSTLSNDEIPFVRSMKIPTIAESSAIFDSSFDNVSFIREEVAYNEAEENCATELIIQAGCDQTLGFEGVAILELISYLAYNSAFTQLRTKEQLGYIVSAFIRRISGGGRCFSVVVQSSSTLPAILEERIEAWLLLFRQELQEIDEDRLFLEKSAVIAQLLERDVKLGEDMARTWDAITSSNFRSKLDEPIFDKVEQLAKVLSSKETSELKQDLLDFFDKYISVASPHRRAMSARSYSQSEKNEMEQHFGSPGYLFDHEDVTNLKLFLETWSIVPYWKNKFPK